MGFVFDGIYKANNGLLGPFKLFELTETLKAENCPCMPTFPIGVTNL